MFCAETTFYMLICQQNKPHLKMVKPFALFKQFQNFALSVTLNAGYDWFWSAMSLINHRMPHIDWVHLRIFDA